jgi:P-type Ca2+ transporter type 2C
MKTLPSEENKLWAIDKNIVLEILSSSVDGLTKAEALDRLKKYGPNTISEKSKNSFLNIILLQIINPLIFILLFAGLVTAYLGEVIEMSVILLAVTINVIFGAYQEYNAENTIEKLKTFIKNKAKVLRDGALHEVDASELVPGDIINLTYGSRIPADARILESLDFSVDESILTGESVPISKKDELVHTDGLTDRVNSVFCGTLVTNGNAMAVVTNTGNNTEFGKIATAVLETDNTPTPVQNAVKKISWYIFSIALVIVIFIFSLGLYRGESIFEMLILSSAVAVGAVPEALPITLTVILSIGVLNISKKGGLIRKLASAETLGSTSLVLTDKTGTITKGELTLNNILPTNFLLGSIDEDINKPLAEINKDQIHLLKTAYLNIQATVEKITEDKNNWLYSGDASEVIILKSLYQYNIDFKKDKGSKLLLPFNSTNKYSISVGSKNSVILGAPDILIQNSDLGSGDKKRLQEILVNLSNQGKRIVGLATKDNNELNIHQNNFQGLFTFSDPIRQGVYESINFIKEHGVTVKVISGDLPGTVRFIASEVGIKASEEEVITGETIRDLGDMELLKILPKIKIFARVTPEDKMRIGNLYRKLGEVVAMTGDGVNDAPALKAMDIGISLASGSDVAKSASDMILLNNDFTTIANTISEGRIIKSNIQKVFVYLMSSSLDEVFVIVGALIAGLALPLNALQIIWVNILNGSLPALAFAYDKDKNLSKKIDKNIFNNKTKFLAIGIGAVSSILLFIFYYTLNKMIDDLLLVRSIFFMCFTIYALVISYSFKNLDRFIFQYNPFNNLRLNIANLIGIGLVSLTVYLPFMQKIFNVKSVPLEYLWLVVAWCLSNVIVIELAKFFFDLFHKESREVAVTI